MINNDFRHETKKAGKHEGEEVKSFHTLLMLFYHYPGVKYYFQASRQTQSLTEMRGREIDISIYR